MEHEDAITGLYYKRRQMDGFCRVGRLQAEQAALVLGKFKHAARSANKIIQHNHQEAHTELFTEESYADDDE